MEKKYKILIVEDEDVLRDRYSEYLTSQGFEVQSASDGKTALDLSANFAFDLMLLDIRLPIMDGLEVLKAIKSNPQTKDKKIILLTVLGRDSIIKEGFDLGADAYLIKDQETPDSVMRNIITVLEGE